MFGLFRKKSLAREIIAKRAVSMLGELLIECTKHNDDFQALVRKGYLGFLTNSTYYCSDFNKMDSKTICYVKLSDIPGLQSIRPAILEPIELVPEELYLAAGDIAAKARPYRG